ncbi:hypothetical protein [Caldibacillus debilis]|jgi:hypothetical protein|uniref:Uncharacterized protein n=2 Tax=Caldibacillus debilis TaxID=301148 RepID=A0A420VCF0_9BACI|nr:hypothetical protein [Caldibacillus debilis]KYD10322.1 hypothetical protein B4135_3497 [Caldibacillus debilis]RKO61292.1 hypothetical protein Cdeb_01607 [Caldibacillus debilis GB1]
MGSIVITEEMVARFFQLVKKEKEIEKELNQLKRQFNDYFDAKVGNSEKGEKEIGPYRLQRQIRVRESYKEEEVVRKLEELNLRDCIQYIKKPDYRKLEAAIALGLLSEGELDEYKERKFTPVITVKIK